MPAPYFASKAYSLSFFFLFCSETSPYHMRDDVRCLVTQMKPLRIRFHLDVI